LEIIAKGGELNKRPLANARLFTQIMALDEAASPIVPLVLGDAERALALSEGLEAAGFLVAAIRPPTVPMGTARLRFTFSAGHSEDQVSALADAVRAQMAGMA
jgi:8-amino-7-oxononanoate synthase